MPIKGGLAMKKSFLLLTAFVLVISIFIIMIQKDKITSPAAGAIEAAFSETGAAAVSSEIYVRGTSKRKVFDENDVRGLLEDMITGAGGHYSKDIPAFKAVENDYVEGIEVSYIIDENKTVQMSVTNEKNRSTDKNSTLCISFFDTSSNPDVQANTDVIIQCLEKYGIGYESNISLTGIVNGRLGEDEIGDICLKALKRVGADTVEGMNDNGLVSVSAFSPSISESVSVRGRKVNMNIAVRYNSYEGKTYIWLATPVITTEY